MGTSSIIFSTATFAGGYNGHLAVYPIFRHLSTAITALRNYCDVCGNLGAVCDITPSQAESVFHRNDEYSMAIHDIAICGLICILCINVLMYIYIYIYVYIYTYVYIYIYILMNPMNISDYMQRYS